MFAGIGRSSAPAAAPPAAPPRRSDRDQPGSAAPNAFTRLLLAGSIAWRAWWGLRLKRGSSRWLRWLYLRFSERNQARIAKPGRANWQFPRRDHNR